MTKVGCYLRQIDGSQCWRGCSSLFSSFLLFWAWTPKNRVWTDGRELFLGGGGGGVDIGMDATAVETSLTSSSTTWDGEVGFGILDFLVGGLGGLVGGLSSMGRKGWAWSLLFLLNAFCRLSGDSVNAGILSLVKGGGKLLRNVSSDWSSLRVYVVVEMRLNCSGVVSQMKSSGVVSESEDDTESSGYGGLFYVIWILSSIKWQENWTVGLLYEGPIYNPRLGKS